ncbi:MAG: choice-of-anchor L domain-containing protein [Crocinitomicaceae bacterium]|nr:choice-of-anchor L domain-containing protein [Crocinitomicaceae bacterium]
MTIRLEINTEYYIRFLRIVGLMYLLLYVTGLSFSQLTVDNSVNGPDGVQNILLGQGVTASNITFASVNDQIGSFTCTGCNLNLASGLVMGSGNVSGAPGPNNSSSFSLTPASGWGASDPDLFMLSGFGLNDAAVLQFDFIPTGDSIKFKFVFASDEYPEYANSSFNDAFGFFLSGPGISGPYSNNSKNIALIPNTAIPVTINNLNNGSSGTGPCEYCQYYVNNNVFGILGIQADGFTKVLTAKAQVQCGQTYHIKIAIADAGDTGYDSWVFLEAGSFASNQIQVAYTGPVNFSPGADMVYEGCETAYLNFTRPSSQTAAATYTVTLSGTAQNGVDYQTVSTTLSYAPNQMVATIPITAIDDNILEGNETLIVSVGGTTNCGQMITAASYTITITDLPPLNVTVQDVMINCGQTAVITPQVSGGIGYYSVHWPNNVVSPSYFTSPSIPVSIPFQVLDTCGVDPFNGVANVSFITNPPLVVDLGPDQSITCLDSLDLSPIVSGGFGQYNYQWLDNGTPVSTGTQLSYDPLGEGTIQLEITDECGVQSLDEMIYTVPPVPVIVDIGPDLILTCLNDTLLSSLVTGGVGTYTYSWTNQGQVLGTSSQLNYAANSNQSLTLSATDQCGNTGQDAVNISVPPVPVIVDLGQDIIVSCQSQADILPQVSGGVGSYSYLWLLQGTVAGNGSNYSYIGNSAGNTAIALTVTDECGNQGNDMVNVQVPSEVITIDLGPDINVTCLDQTNLDGAVSGGIGNYSYTWSINGLVASSQPLYNVQTGEDASVILSVVDECGNVGQDIIQINVPPVQVMADAGADVEVGCLDSTNFSGQAQGGVGTYTYSWTDGNTILSNGISAVYQTMVDADLTFTVTDQCGNSASDNVEVVVPPVPIQIQLTPDTSICLGEYVELNGTAVGGVGTLQHLWLPVNSTYSNIHPAPGESTVYTYSASDVCGNSASETVTVGVEQVEPGFTVEYIGETGIELTNHTYNGVSYIWNFNDGSVEYTTDVAHDFSTNDAIVVTLTAIGPLGCVQKHTETFYPFADIFVPNSFTPNEDGINDLFFAKGHDLRSFKMSIFNRWGDMVFHTDDIDVPWNGSQRGGDYFVPDGIYNYQVVAVGIRGNVIEKRGFVLIIR